MQIEEGPNAVMASLVDEAAFADLFLVDDDVEESDSLDGVIAAASVQEAATHTLVGAGVGTGQPKPKAKKKKTKPKPRPNKPEAEPPSPEMSYMIEFWTQQGQHDTDLADAVDAASIPDLSTCEIDDASLARFREILSSVAFHLVATKDTVKLGLAPKSSTGGRGFMVSCAREAQVRMKLRRATRDAFTALEQIVKALQASSFPSTSVFLEAFLNVIKKHAGFRVARFETNTKLPSSWSGTRPDVPGMLQLQLFHDVSKEPQYLQQVEQIWTNKELSETEIVEQIDRLRSRFKRLYKPNRIYVLPSEIPLVQALLSVHYIDFVLESIVYNWIKAQGAIDNQELLSRLYDDTDFVRTTLENIQQDYALVTAFCADLRRRLVKRPRGDEP